MFPCKSCFLLCLSFFSRWRCVFLTNLVFGLPTMFAMMLFMLIWPHSLAGGYCQPRSPNTSTEAPPSHLQPMFLPGLSWENFILWLLATPVQVRPNPFSCIAALELSPSVFRPLGG